MLTLLIASSRFLEAGHPAKALALFPFNVEAQVGSAIATLNSGEGQDTSALESAMRSSLRASAGDARLYSLLGEIEYRRGDRDGAFQLFDHARALSKTEIHALKREMLRSIEAGRFADAVSGADVMLRRRPEMLASLAPLFPSILADDVGYAAVAKAIGASPPWRNGMIRLLARNPDGIAFADRLLLDLKRGNTPPRSGELAAVIGAYFADGQYDLAYRLFLFSLSDKERALVGYVYNDTFAALPLNRPFDWQLRDQSGVEVKFGAQLAGTQPGGATPSTGATFRFLNRPVRYTPIQQELMLPPGAYTMTLNATARNVKLPKGLFWTLTCRSKKEPLLKLSVSEGSFDKRDFVGKFTVEAQGCAVQHLSLETATVAQSWRYRYVGVLTAHSLRIEKLTS